MSVLYAGLIIDGEVIRKQAESGRMRRNGYSKLWDIAFEEEVLGSCKVSKVGRFGEWKLLCKE